MFFPEGRSLGQRTMPVESQAKDSQYAKYRENQRWSMNGVTFVTLHIDNLRGDNAHHQCETIFKAFGRALRMATEPDSRMSGVVPSTKGTL